MVIEGILNGLLMIVIAGALCLPYFFKKTEKGQLVIVFLVVVFFYNFLLTVGLSLYLNNWSYNWAGHILSALFALIVMWFLKWRIDGCEFGLTLKQKKGSLKPVLFVVIAYAIIKILAAIFLFGKGDVTIENYLFQATMPGISEELIYRGLYLGILNEIFEKKKTIFGAQMGYACIVVTLLFVLSHGLSISASLDISINLLAMINPLIFGLIVVWIRERTGSVLIPIIFHNFTNELGVIVRDFK